MTFLGIYCRNMNHDASLWYLCGCSVLSPQDLHGVDFIWFSTSVSEWKPHELRCEGSQEPEWAALFVAVLVCLYSMAAVCADLNHFRGDSVGTAPTSSSFHWNSSVDERVLGWCSGLPRRLQTFEALRENVAKILEHWPVCFLTSYLWSWELVWILNPGGDSLPREELLSRKQYRGAMSGFFTWWRDWMRGFSIERLIVPASNPQWNARGYSIGTVYSPQKYKLCWQNARGDDESI